MPLVSVIIPSFNAGKYILETIQSVFNQTYQNFEIIVIDDGSTDNTESLLSHLLPNILYIKTQNQGVAAARNTGLELAKGKYVCFLDADDWFYPENLAKKVSFLEMNPHIKIVHSWVEVTDESLVPDGLVLKGAEGWVSLKLLNLELPIPCPSNVLIQTEVVRELNGFDKNLSTSADFDLWIRLAQVSEAGCIREALIKYRRHPGAMFNNVSLFEKDMLYIIKKYSSTISGPWSGLQAKIHKTCLLSRIKQKKPLPILKHSLSYIFHCTKAALLSL